uniref:Uncharacterized protein n=1 Tax=Heliothis virescens TaxID=7102 RepID=A0A2A4JUT3_HELVI
MYSVRAYKDPKSENDFQEVRCDKVFEAMRKCCVKFKPLNSSLVCEGYDLEPRKYAQVTDRPAK